ncbi:MAG: Acg family FMN-binding oxidoreductase [Candidatus Limnocylindria bacterium]
MSDSAAMADPRPATAQHPFPPGPGLLRWLVQHAVKAPSVRNSQPWRFRIATDTIELFADRSRALTVVDPNHRELIISCGAALDHLRVAAREAGYDAVVDRRPGGGDPDLLARIKAVPAGGTTDGDRALFAAMHRRCSQRVPFGIDPPPRDLIERLGQVGADSTLEVRTVTDRSEVLALADLVRDAQARQFRTPAYRNEIANWSRSNESRQRDGVPGYASGLGRIQALAEPTVLRRFAAPGPPDYFDADLTTQAPLLVVLATDGDAPADWLQAGETLSELMLRLTAAGLSASFLNQPIQVTQLRWKLRSMLGIDGFPQVMLRVGSVTEVPMPTPRRRTGEVIEP